MDILEFITNKMKSYLYTILAKIISEAWYEYQDVTVRFFLFRFLSRYSGHFGTKKISYFNHSKVFTKIHFINLFFLFFWPNPGLIRLLRTGVQCHGMWVHNLE